MKTIKDLKQMIREPASKEWFAKHGSPQSKALGHAKIPKKPVRYLSAEERKEKTKTWPKGREKALTTAQKVDYQRRIGRAYSD